MSTFGVSFRVQAAAYLNIFDDHRSQDNDTKESFYSLFGLWSCDLNAFGFTKCKFSVRNRVYKYVHNSFVWLKLSLYCSTELRGCIELFL